jgi:hypothetical protein
MKKIYLAIPYTGMENASFIKANRIAAKLIKQGNIVYSAISMSHPIAIQNELPEDWNFWQKQDEAFIQWCDEVHIIKLNGRWKQSTGVLAEIGLANKYHKIIKFI